MRGSPLIEEGQTPVSHADQECGVSLELSVKHRDAAGIREGRLMLELFLRGRKNEKLMIDDGQYKITGSCKCERGEDNGKRRSVGGKRLEVMEETLTEVGLRSTWGNNATSSSAPITWFTQGY